MPDERDEQDLVASGIALGEVACGEANQYLKKIRKAGVALGGLRITGKIYGIAAS